MEQYRKREEKHKLKDKEMSECERKITNRGQEVEKRVWIDWEGGKEGWEEREYWWMNGKEDRRRKTRRRE